jgi:hypothetical protein
MRFSAIDLAWLAGITDGEGCLSVKGFRGARKTATSVSYVLCNTSKPMIDRAAKILDAIGVRYGAVRKVWKGDRATRWQYWIEVSRKHDLLRLMEILTPYLTAKQIEAEVLVWFLRRSCAAKQYRTTPLDIALLKSLSAIKLNGGEAPAEIERMIREVIPSQAIAGHCQADDEAMEGVETRSVSPNNTPTHECPAPLRLVQQG